MKMKVWLCAVLTLCLFQIAFGQVGVTPPTQEDTLRDAARARVLLPQNVLPTATPPNNAGAPELGRVGYLVGPGDVIKGTILGEEQFNFTATIDEDGKFQVPFFDKPVMAKCKTEMELTRDVRTLLSKYLKMPLVSVSVMDRKSRPPATIYGEIRSPQQVIMTRKVRLLDLLAFAGGVNTEKAGGAIQIFHTQPPLCEETYEDGTGTAEAGSEAGFPFRVYSLNSVQQGSNVSNPIIYPGDIIVVKEALPVFIVGEVGATGKLLMPEGGLPLSQALATVGGVRIGAKTKSIKIYRLKANSKDREVIAVNYDLIRKGTEKDVLLSPYDIVEVGKAPKSIGEILIGIATNSLNTIGNTLPRTILP